MSTRVYVISEGSKSYDASVAVYGYCKDLGVDLNDIKTEDIKITKSLFDKGKDITIMSFPSERPNTDKAVLETILKGIATVTID